MRRSALPALLFVTFAAPAASAGTLNLADIAADLSFVETRAQKTVASLSPMAGLFPRSGGETGKWQTVGATDWTSGFFPGQLWLLYQATGSTQWLKYAQAWTKPLASQATRTDTHDVGFIIGESFGNGYRLTGDSAYKSELLTAGASLATRYNPKVGAVRSWSFAGPWQYPVIIDNMMTLGPLQWGATNGGNFVWGSDATTHAKTTIANFIRSNGSTFEVSNFNPTTGALIDHVKWAGLSVDSTWSRGQAWGLYGFVQAYEVTGNSAFLTTAENLADYFFTHLPSDFVPYWDFNAQATPTTPRDSSAGAIAADGLVMLSTVAQTKMLKTKYLAEAEDILGSLSSSAYRAPASGEAVLAHGSNASPGTPAGTAVIWGDYFYTEALVRLENDLEGKPGWILYSPTPATEILYSPATTPVPEPSTWTMLLLGFAGVGLIRYRWAKGAQPTIFAG
jgi:unsaturated chondroitin disaccharide hydrolase